jgi:hypothetical protein
MGGWVWYIGDGEYVSYVPIFKIAPKILLGKTVYYQVDCRMRLVFGCKNTALWILVAVKHTQNKTPGILLIQWNLKCCMFRLNRAIIRHTNNQTYKLQVFTFVDVTLTGVYNIQVGHPSVSNKLKTNWCTITFFYSLQHVSARPSSGSFFFLLDYLGCLSINIKI